MNVGIYTVLDGNGDPLEDGVRYFNRYQSKVPHDLTLTCIRLKDFKTVGGFVKPKPVVDFVVNYANGVDHL